MAFDRDAWRIKAALVALGLSWDAGGDGLCTLESRGGVEVRALFATVQFKTATRALAGKIGARREDNSAAGTAGNRVRTGHAESPRAEGLLPRPGRFFRALGAGTGIHVTPLPVFSCHDVIFSSRCSESGCKEPTRESALALIESRNPASPCLSHRR